MFCCASLRGQSKGEFPALSGIGAVVEGDVLYIRALHCDRSTRRRKVFFELYSDDTLVQTVQVWLPALDRCDEASHHPHLNLEVIG